MGVPAAALLAGAYFLPGFGVMVGTLALAAAAVLAYVSARCNAANAARWKAIGSYFELSPEGFERHVGETYRYLGYHTTLTPRVGDQGVDVLARSATEIIAIQCKRYSERASNSAVQAVHAGRAHYRCSRAVVICLGGFTPSALALARSTGVELVNGIQYAELVRRLAPQVSTRPRLILPTGRALLYLIALVALSAVAFGLGLVPHSAGTPFHHVG
jgi:hypothetical protein